MRLYSTRNPSHTATFREAVLANLAPDGGLFLPSPRPPFPDLDALLRLDGRERNLEILDRLMEGEFTREEWAGVLDRALDFPVPLVPITEQIWTLELFHGPSLAFKDFGARFLAQVLSLMQQKGRTILTATSGDTGAAVAHAFLKVEGFQVVVLYPQGRVSELQERQFATLGENVHALAVEGNFDDCQAMVKRCFADADLVARRGLTSANSINIARLLAQSLYYFEAAAQLAQGGSKAPLLFSVPSGNFGNLCAGLLARSWGLQARFCAATNANRTVPDYLESGRYEPRPSLATLSNAMDVGAPSNWERISALYGGDWMRLRQALGWGSLDDPETLRELEALKNLGYLADPHGAVAYGVLKQQLQDDEIGIFLETAHPAKFADRLSWTVPLPQSLAELQSRTLRSTAFPSDATKLKDWLNQEA